MSTQQSIRGCLLGGAIGDALGLPVEFNSLSDIIRKHGPAGITGFQPCYGGLGKFSDDTQMTLFTLVGLLNAHLLDGDYLHHGAVAQLEWLRTQGIINPILVPGHEPVSLLQERELFSRRAPGNTCLSSLSSMKRVGDLAKNDSKGCGAVMRMAPVGLFCYLTGRNDAFAMGNHLGALTHAHPSGYLSAGALAVIVQQLLEGMTVKEACQEAMRQLICAPGHEETLEALTLALALAEADTNPRAAIRRLGEGWVAEEALAIAVYCALIAKDFRDGVLIAVNHDGDTDSTGAICGNILGAALGEDAIPQEWRSGVELSALIARLSNDLIEHCKKD
ncbi:ADP-ribosylglycohydrolase family protein [Escherichia coli]